MSGKSRKISGKERPIGGAAPVRFPAHDPSATGRHLRRLLLSPPVIVFFLALFVRAAYLGEIVGTPIWHWHLWDQSDMDTFLKVARQILTGDLLVRDPYHPFHLWQREIAPVDQWSAWYGPHTFHQVPGYYYFLALLLKISGGSLATIKVIQSILGAVHASLLGAIGQRIMGPTGGLIVGILAATYGPFVATEPMLLREGVALLSAALALFMTLRALDRPPHDRSRRTQLSWLTAGVVLGINALVKETGFVLFAATWLWMLVRALRRRDHLHWSAAFVLLLGFASGLSPLVLRNVAVGASPLAFTPQGAINFVLGNAIDAPEGGVMFGLGASFRAIMEQSHGRLLPTILATLQSYSQQPALLLAHLWAKFSAIWSNVEAPDNFNYEYLQVHSTLLQVLPRFVCVWLPAALGLIMLAIRWGRRRAVSQAGGLTTPDERSTFSIPFSTEVLALLLVILGAHAFSQALMPVMSRYRLVIVPFLMLPAGWALAQGLTWIRNARWFACCGMSAGLGGLLLLWLLWPAHPYRARAVERIQVDFFIGGSILMGRNDIDGARREFEQGIAYLRSHTASYRDLQEGELRLRLQRLVLFASAGHLGEVQDDWRIVSHALPDNPIVQEIRRKWIQPNERHDPGTGPGLPGDAQGKTR